MTPLPLLQKDKLYAPPNSVLEDFQDFMNNYFRNILKITTAESVSHTLLFPLLTSSLSDLLCLLNSLLTMYNLVQRQTRDVKLWHFISPQDKRIPLLQLLSSPRRHSPPYGWSPGGFVSWKTLWIAGSLIARQHFLTNFSQQFSVTTTLSICHRLPSVEPCSYSSLR